MCFRSACAVTHPLRHAACILSRRHKLPGRLGAVATAAGAGCVRVIGGKGAGNGQVQYACGFAFDGEGNLVVSDCGNHRIQVFRYIDGAHLRTIGSKGAGNGQFNQPYGIAFDGAGRIIVCDSSNHRVQVLRYIDGAHVRTIGSQGSRNGQFNFPKGIAVDGEGNVAVFDSAVFDYSKPFKPRVQVHRLSDGAYMRTIGGKGQFSGSSHGIAFDSAGNLVVADAFRRVQVLRHSDGAHLRTINFGYEHPAGVAFDAAGHIVVAFGDAYHHRVQVLRYSDGSHVRTIFQRDTGKRMLGQRQFNGPIAIDSDGRIVAMEDGVQVLE
jgi:DNA-binding beta-propeller fold protein YncE